MSRVPAIWPTATAGSATARACCIAQNGPGITNFVTAVAAAYWAHSPVVVITPETGSAGHRPRRLPGDRSAADLLQDHQVPGPCRPPGPDRRADQPLLRSRADGARPDPAQHPARHLLWRGRRDHPQADPRRARRRRRGEPGRGRQGPGRRQIPGHRGRRRRDHVRRPGRGRRLAEHLSAPVVTSYLHNDAFPRAIR